MAKIKVTFELFDELEDPDDSTGMNVTTFEHIHTALMQVGDDIDIERID